jgi:hypothetical protein
MVKHESDHITWCYSADVRRIFKARTFSRWSRKASLPDATLCAAVAEMASGLIDADLGGMVYKKRIPMPGRGKRGGARTILGSNLEDRWFFLFGFEKSERTTIDERELAALRKIAASLLALDTNLLERALDEEELTEICHEKQPLTQ